MQAFKCKGLFQPASNNLAGTVAIGNPADEMARRAYLQAIRSDAPVSPYSHLKEDQSDFGPVYVALSVLMRQAASAKVKVYKWHPDAKTEGDAEAKEYLPRAHAICKLMRKPNHWDSGRMMRARAVQQRALTGSWLGWRVDEGDPRHSHDDKPVEIWTVPTGLYTAIAPSPMYPDGAYRVTPWWPGPYALLPGAWQQGGVIVPAENMIACRTAHPLMYKEGLSPLAACAPEMDTLNGIGFARKSIIRRAPVPSGTIEMQSDVVFPDMPMLNRIMAQVYNMLGGPERAGRPAILGPGMKWVPSEVAGLELPWTDSWEQLLSFVYTVFGVTKTLVGQTEATSYAALYAILKQFRLGVLQPELDDIADALNTQCIHPFWGDEYGIEFEPEAVGDEELLEKQLSTDLQAGIRTFDEWRSIRKLPKVGGKEGAAYVKAGAKEQQPGAPGAEGGDPSGMAMKPAEPGSDPVEQSKPKNPLERMKSKNGAGGGSLPPRIAAMMNGRNGKH